MTFRVPLFILFITITVVRGNTKPLVTIGTRGSPLALAQVFIRLIQLNLSFIDYNVIQKAYETKRLLGLHFPELSVEGSVEIRKIMTKGDSILNQALSEIGGKGLFTKELDVALLDNSVGNQYIIFRYRVTYKYIFRFRLIFVCIL